MRQLHFQHIDSYDTQRFIITILQHIGNGNYQCATILQHIGSCTLVMGTTNVWQRVDDETLCVGMQLSQCFI